MRPVELSGGKPPGNLWNLVMFLNVIVAYFIGVVIGHYLLLRRIKKVKAQIASSNEVRARIGKRANVLTQSESTRYIRWIWLWPIYTSSVLPFMLMCRSIAWAFKKMGFGEVYRDFYTRLEEMGTNSDCW